MDTNSEIKKELGKGYCNKCDLEAHPTMLCKCTFRKENKGFEELLDWAFPMNGDVLIPDGDSRGLRQRFLDLYKQHGEICRQEGREEERKRILAQSRPMRGKHNDDIIQGVPEKFIKDEPEARNNNNIKN